MTLDTRPRILVVEDGSILALMIETMLTELGYRSVKAARIAAAMELASSADLAAALLDININGEGVYPVAGTLRRRGIPFAFMSGYEPEAVDPEHADRPFLMKPVLLEDLREALRTMLLQSGPTP
jgi:CheY-like chemotaxis protein